MHSVVAPIIGVINPNQPVTVRINVGNTSGADATQKAVYATPGALTASIGGTFTASVPDPVNNPTTLSVSAVLTGSLQPGDAISGTDGTNTLPAGTTVLAQLTGPAGGIGTYMISQNAVLNACTVTSASTVLNVTGITAGVLQPGQTLADSGALDAGTMVTEFISGLRGGAGLYSISQQQTVASELMTTAMVIDAQIQALSGGDLRHMDALNLTGSHRNMYFNGVISGGVRVSLKGGDLITTRDNSVWLVTTSGEPWGLTAGWSRVIVTLQDGG